MRASSENYYEFGEFRLDAGERVLSRGDDAIDVTPKAFEILLLLVKNAGRTVTKDEIFQSVWPDSFVEETNLSHHIFRLRKMLGESEETKFIETVPRRGYRFIADVRAASAPNDVLIESGVLPALTHRTGRFPFLAVTAALLVLASAAFLLYRSGILARNLPEESSVPISQEPQSISRITNGGKFVAATISPDGKFVAYGQNYTSGEGNLYIRQLETNTERRLLEPADRNFGSINFSPDGTFIYYIAYEPGDPEGALYRIPVIGGQAAKLLGDVKFMFSLSPDAKHVTFYRFDPSNQRRLVTVKLEGRPEEKTILTFPNSGISGVPAFSPDGRFISFSSADLGSDFTQPQFALSVVELATGQTRRLSEEKWFEIGKTVWKPDGSGLVFPGNRPRSGTQLYTMSFPAGEVRQITDELNYYGNYGMGIMRDGSAIVADLWDTQAQLWAIDATGSTAGAEQLTNGTSDGSIGLAAMSDGQIVYSTRSGEDRDIWVLRDSGGVREGKPLTADPASEGGLCSPADGRFVVFASDREGSSHLFRITADGKDLKQITTGSGFESSPECSADGSFILFESGSRIWRVGSDGGEPVPLTDFECVAPSLSPDGEQFACIQPTHIQIKNATLAVVPVTGGPPVKSYDVIPFGFYYRPARWTPDGKGLLFKRTEKQIGNLWRQDVSGGPPRKISDFRSDSIFNHVYTADGKQLIVSRGKVAFNTVLIRNFD